MANLLLICVTAAESNTQKIKVSLVYLITYRRTFSKALHDLTLQGFALLAGLGF